MCLAPVRFEYEWTPQDYDYSQFEAPDYYEYDHDMDMDMDEETDKAIDIDDVFDFLENEFDPIMFID